jgi:hypothetical protein
MKLLSLLLVTLSAISFSFKLQAANPAEAKTIGRTIRAIPELSFTKNGYEFLSKYSQFCSSSQNNRLRTVIVDDQPVAQLAAEAWKSRNAFRDLLRLLEQKEDRIVDSYLMQLPNKSRFGR